MFYFCFKNVNSSKLFFFLIENKPNILDAVLFLSCCELKQLNVFECFLMYLMKNYDKHVDYHV